MRSRNWEQGRTAPDPAARVLLIVIDQYPGIVEAALTAGSSEETAD